MVILASDTSTKTLSVALYINDKENVKMINITKDTKMTHSGTHMPLIMEVLEDNGLKFKDVDIFACTVGPGSYTGVRIGVSTTKTMAYAAGKDSIGVSTLETLAYQYSKDTVLVCPLIDARNRRAFCGCYFNGNLVIDEANRTIEEMVLGISDFLKSKKNDSINTKHGEDNQIKTSCETLNSINTVKDFDKIREIIFCGDAADIYCQDEKISMMLSEVQKEGNIEKVSFIKTNPEARDVALLALNKYNQEIQNLEVFSPFLLKPNYLSPSQAQRMKKLKQSE